MKLSIVRELKERIEEKAALVENLRGALEIVSAPTLDGLPKAKSFQTSKIESLTAEIVDAERELENLRGELIEVSIRLPEEILELVKDRRAAQVLIKRYVFEKTFKEIALESSYSESRIFSLHRQGVKQYNSAEQ